MKKLNCKVCGGVLIPNGTTYICEDCRRVYKEEELKALSMQVSVKAPRVATKKESKSSKIEVKPFKIEKPIVVANPKLKEAKVGPKLVLKNKVQEEKPELKKVRAIKPIGAGEDPKDGPKNDKKLKTKIDESSMLSSLLILAKDAMDKGQYSNAISYCDKILRLDINNRNAYLIKGEATISSKLDIDTKLGASIECYRLALKNTNEIEYDDLAFRINQKYIEIVREYLLSKLDGFKESLDSKYLAILKSELKHLDKFARIANKELGMDLKLHYEVLARAVIDLVGSVSKKAINAFNLERMRQTDEAYLEFKSKMDGCIRIWEYTLTFSIKAETILEALDNLYKAHHAIINSCGHKLSGKKLKVSACATAEEKVLREARIEGYKNELRKYYLRDEDRIEYQTASLKIKTLNNEKKAILKKIKEFKEIKEIKELEDLNKFLAQSGRFKEAKENLGRLNSLNRELLVKTRDLTEQIEAIDKKILYISIESLYLNLD